MPYLKEEKSQITESLKNQLHLLCSFVPDLLEQEFEKRYSQNQPLLTAL